MDGGLHFELAKLVPWTQAVFWPFLRVGAMMMVAPVFGARFVPARIRIIAALAITAMLVPLLPQPPVIEPLSGEAVLVTAEQVAIGATIGFVMQLTFDALIFAGEMAAMSMGLGFASMVDPDRGVQVPVVGQFYLVMVTLLFLSLQGHLLLIRLLVESFHWLPIGHGGLSATGAHGIAEWGARLFAGGVSVALPAVASMLVVNMGLGVMSRAAPALNLFAVGFPLSLGLGLLVLMLSLPVVQGNFTSLINDAAQTLHQSLREPLTGSPGG